MKKIIFFKVLALTILILSNNLVKAQINETSVKGIPSDNSSSISRSSIIAQISPTITVTDVTNTVLNAEVGQNEVQTIDVRGVNLSNDINLTITGSNAALFELDKNIVQVSAANNSTNEIAIKYKPNVAGNHSATLTLKSTGATDIIRTLTGNASIPISRPNVIITEVYGGGGNSGASFQNDFVELYNNTEASIDISGWSVQYYSETGTSSTSTTISIPNGKSIGGKKYFLISGKSGTTTNLTLLPTPDVSNDEINISATSGKVVLYSTNTSQTLANSTDLSLITGNSYFIDYLPFGSATPIWVSALGSPSNTTSASRKLINGVYQFTPNIGSDFERILPDPRNSGFTTNITQTILTPLTISNGKIKFSATAGESIEIYNATGQILLKQKAIEGLNTISISTQGVVLVKIGTKIAKVIL